MQFSASPDLTKGDPPFDLLSVKITGEFQPLNLFNFSSIQPARVSSLGIRCQVSVFSFCGMIDLSEKNINLKFPFTSLLHISQLAHNVVLTFIQPRILDTTLFGCYGR